MMETGEQWMPDVLALSVLDKWGIPSTLEYVPLDDIDEKGSLANQAREDAISQDVVDQYAAAMKSGDRFPAGVGHRNGSGKIIIDGGNQRYRAARISELPGMLFHIVPDYDDEQLKAAIPKLLNTVTGCRPSKRECVDAAVRMVRSFAWSTEDAAKHFQVSTTSVNQRIRATEAQDRLVVVKGKRSRLPDTTIAAISSIQSDQVLAATADLVESARLTSDEAKDIAKKIRGARSEKEQMEVVEDSRRQWGVPSRSLKRTPAAASVSTGSAKIRSVFLRALAGLENAIRTKKALAALGITGIDEQKAIASRIRDLSAALLGIVRRPVQDGASSDT
jgi:hypothetical protein